MLRSTELATVFANKEIKYSQTEASSQFSIPHDSKWGLLVSKASSQFWHTQLASGGSRSVGGGSSSAPT